MPSISRFYGIVIYIYYGDHDPPHFHAKYKTSEAQVEIGSARIMNGSLPPRAIDLVTEWAGIHRTELFAAWNIAQSGTKPPSIKPLP